MEIIERRGSKLYLLDENGDPTTTSFGSSDEASQWMEENGTWGVIDESDQRKARPLTDKQIIERAKRQKPRTYPQRFWKHSPHRFRLRAERRAKKLKENIKRKVI